LKGTPKVRVIAGKSKGRRLKTPKEGGKIRPLTDRARGALFNILCEEVPDAKFLDLFAGTGAVGIEALSRGAEIAFFVDVSKQAVGLIRENLELTKLSDRTEVFAMDAVRALRLFVRKEAKFDIIFMGAPYEDPKLEESLKTAAESNLLNINGILIAEHRKQHSLDGEIDKLIRYRRAVYGETMFDFFKAKI